MASVTLSVMLRRLELQDFVIVPSLALELGPGFTGLTGETGAGKSILVDALQLALGARADAGVVREGATRAEIAAEFDTPAALRPWLDEGGFQADTDSMLLRRVVDAQGKSRAWINGSPATVTQLREAAEHLVDIHGQHAWQSLTRADAVRALLDGQSGGDTAAVREAFGAWRHAQQALQTARERQSSLEQERERLHWQIGELSRLAPGSDEWGTLNAEHRRLAHGQSLLEAARQAVEALSEGEPAADALMDHAADALDATREMDPELAAVGDVVREAQALLQDAARSLQAYLAHQEPDPQRLSELDQRLSVWVSLARRFRRQPDELPALLESWQAEAAALDAATDLQALEAAVSSAFKTWQVAARELTRARQAAAPKLARAVTAAMQQLGMTGGRFEVSLVPQDEPQAHGAESVEFRVAGHAGATPRPLAKVASGGELSRLALAIAATTAAAAKAAPGASKRRRPAEADATPATLIFDEIDAGVGGDVAHAVGRLMKQLGATHQVLAVTHLAQVAACADAHLVVSKQAGGGRTVASDVQPVTGEARVSEIARMLGGSHLGETGRAHAQAMLEDRK